jgi:drug/metabolite transporter (DMT)-like permease
VPVATSAAWAAAALLVNAFLWGVSWWPFRALQEQGVHGLWATALVYAAVGAAVLVWDRSVVRRLLATPSLWPLLVASGITNACFNWAVTIGDVVRVVLLFYLMPAWAALLARLVLGEPLRGAVVLRVAIAIAGAAVVLKPPGEPWPLPTALSDWLAIVGGFTFAATNVMLRREATQSESLRAFTMFTGGCAVAGGLAIVLTIGGGVPAPPIPAPGWLAGIAGLVLMLGFGNLCLQYGASRLPANVTSVVLLSEVPFAAISAVMIGGESVATRTLVGGAMIVAAALLAVRDAR